MIRVFLALGAIQALIMLVQWAKTKVMAVLLGPDLVGVMAVVDKLVAVGVQTLSLSLPFAATVFLPALWMRDPEGFRALLRRMARVLLGVIGLAGLGGAFLTWSDPAFWGSDLAPYQDVVIAAFLGAPALALAPFIQNVLASRFKERRAVLFTLAHACVATAAAVVGVLWKGLLGFYALYAAGGLILALVVLVPVLRGAGDAPGSGRRPSGESERRPIVDPRSGFVLPGRMWRFSGLLLIITFAAPYAALFVHYAVLRELGATAAGWMQAAVGISIAVKGVLGAANAVFLTPNVNRGESPARTMTWADTYARTLVLLAGLLVPPLLMWPDLAVRILYAESFAPGASFVALFVCAEVFGLFIAVYQSLPVAFDHMPFHVGYNVVAQGALVAVAWLLVPTLGITGAAFAIAMPYLVAAIAVSLFLKARYGLVVPARVVVPGVVVLTLLGLSGLIGASVEPFTRAGLGVRAAAYLAILLVVWSLLDGTERRKARGMLSGVLPGKESPPT